MTLLIGSHVSMSKPDYLLGSIREAVSYGASCFMFYTGAPQNTLRAPLSTLNIEQYKTSLKEHHIDINNLVVHAPYIINIGTCNHAKHVIATSILKTEVYRTNACGCQYLVLHPGFATDGIKTEAIKQIAKSINDINKTNKDVIICLETMSGKGTEVGSNLEELAAIIKLIDNKKLIGVCLDTCHINDAGLDPHDVDSVLNTFDTVVGLSYLKVIHLNDSKNKIGEHKDRHENIGYGTLGFKTLCK
jgi:deoxyribonuclease-4